MKVAALQQFLRNLGSPFSALGVPQQSLGALAACAEALESFQGLELADLADFLKRAEEARRTGAVPLVDVPEIAPVGEVSRKLGEDAKLAESAEGEEAKELERRINLHRHQLQSKITDLAQQFGISVKCTEVDNWVGLVRGKKLVERLKAAITSPESYGEPAVDQDVNKLVELGDPTLKQLAGVFGVSTKKKGRQGAEDILAAVTQHRPVGKKAASKAPKKEKADQTAVDEMIRSLKEKVEQVKQNPHALSTTDVDDVIAQLRTKFGSKQQQEIALAVTGSKGKNGEDAVIRIRSALASVKQNLDSQNA
jgi:hypothetical protein